MKKLILTTTRFRYYFDSSKLAIKRFNLISDTYVLGHVDINRFNDLTGIQHFGVNDDSCSVKAEYMSAFKKIKKCLKRLKLI